METKGNQLVRFFNYFHLEPDIEDPEEVLAAREAELAKNYCLRELVLKPEKQVKLGFWKRFSKERWGFFCFVVLSVWAFIMTWLLLFEPIAYGYPALVNRFAISTALHPFGRDGMGRDYLFVLFKSAIYSLLSSGFASVVGGALGLFVGLAAALLGGNSGDFILQLADALDNLNDFFVVLCLASFFPEVGLQVCSMAYAVIYWGSMARIVRDYAVPFLESDYVQAARLLGISQTRLAFRHLMPALVPVVLRRLVGMTSLLLLLESFFSTMGINCPIDQCYLGRFSSLMMKGEGEFYSPAACFFSMGLLVALATGLRSISEALKEALNPKSISSQ